jgi:oxalate decarboxylase
MDVSLSDWITHTPPALVAQHLNVSQETIAIISPRPPQ